MRTRGRLKPTLLADRGRASAPYSDFERRVELATDAQVGEAAIQIHGCWMPPIEKVKVQTPGSLREPC